MNIIFERCSIRKYQNKAIEKENIELILKAAFCAPSARNAQPWEFIVIEDKSTLQTLSTFTPYAKPLQNATLGVVVCANLNRNSMIDFCEQDLAAATQNMLLQAQTLGIGSVWIGVYPIEERVAMLKEHFKLPEQIVPLWMIAFGYPDEKANIKNKFQESYIHYEKW